MIEKQSKVPEIGDLYRCEKCGLELHVTKACSCDEPCIELKCCGELMKEVSSPPVQNPN